MTQITDKKPVACGGPVMRRTESHIAEAAIPAVSISGDQASESVMHNTVLKSYPDSDPRWGKTPCDDDWPK